MSQTDRRELGNTDSPIEDELEDAFNRTVDEGAQRLHRPWREILVTTLLASSAAPRSPSGCSPCIAVREATGSPLLAGLAFSIGFLALLLGRSELFTEGFMVPVITVSARRASIRQIKDRLVIERDAGLLGFLTVGDVTAR